MLSSNFKIADKQVGDGFPCFIIAEAGSNHNGDIKLAYQLIDAAAEAGADAVKFQHFKAAKLYHPDAGKSGYLKSSQSIYDIIKKMEMPDEFLPLLADHCKNRDIIFLSSPFDEESVDILDGFVPAFKIASYEMTAAPLVEYIAQKGKPLLMSTGTAKIEEVDAAVELIKKCGNPELALLQCTARYPAPLSSLNLRVIQTFKTRYGIPVGFSDHSSEPETGPITAVALGANCIEKHFTLSKKIEGPDHKFALEPHEIKLMVTKIREAEKVLGSGVKETLPEEEELYRFARRSIFATQAIQKGESFSRENIAILRCGVQKAVLAPDQFSHILSKCSKRNIDAKAPIKPDDF